MTTKQEEQAARLRERIVETTIALARLYETTLTERDAATMARSDAEDAVAEAISTLESDDGIDRTETR